MEQLSFQGELCAASPCELSGSMTVPVIYSAPPLETRSVRCTQNQTVQLTPSAGSYGFSEVTVTTQVDPPLQEVELKISDGTHTLVPDPGYYGIAQATVSVTEERWHPNPAWWDIMAIIQAPENQEYPNKCIQLLINGEATTPLSGGVAYKTSDGAYYSTESGSHTWDTTKDLPCTSAYGGSYKTRWLITYYAGKDTTQFAVHNEVIYLVIDAICPSTYTLGIFKDKKLLESFALINQAELNTIRNCEALFDGCSSLREIPLFDTSLHSNFRFMFRNCVALNYVPALDLSRGTSFMEMFYGCLSMQNFPMLTLSKGRYFTRMFAYCTRVRTLPAYDFSSGIDFESTFEGCHSLREVPVLNFLQMESFQSIFHACHNVCHLPPMTLPSSNLMFYLSGCWKLTSALIECSRPINLSATQLNRESLLYLIEHLPDHLSDTPGELVLGETLKKRLTTAEQAIATAKNWVIS